jgi:hypothetical protein
VRGVLQTELVARAEGGEGGETRTWGVGREERTGKRQDSVRVENSI